MYSLYNISDFKNIFFSFIMIIPSESVVKLKHYRGGTEVSKVIRRVRSISKTKNSYANDQCMVLPVGCAAFLHK